MVDGSGGLAALGVALPSLSRAMQKTRCRMLPFGFYHLLRTLHSSRAEVCDLMLVAVRPDIQNAGVVALLFTEMMPQFQKLKKRYVESNPELVDNYRIQELCGHFDKIQHKSRAVFAKAIE